ncbi:MAG: sugar phosphate isomerase/epimerase [Candidatus Hydrogenedentes bacterium]|nr:sugar phosphate isomerase/epimerase [Candidatus Hydrogenedentota bacterium]
MGNFLDRRGFLKSTALGAGMALSTSAVHAAPVEKKYQDNTSPWPLVMNASTIRPAPVRTKIQVTADAGWDGIELWMQDLEAHEKEGGSLKELAQEIKEKGLYVNNIIGLWGCMPPGEDEWNAQLVKTRNMMRMCHEVGSPSVAALPFPDREDFDLAWGAVKYKELMKIGREEYDLRVAFEFIGFLKGVHRLGQAAAVAIDADERDAGLIMDTFHLYRGGSGFSGIKHLDPRFMADFHWNDVPATPGQFELKDKDRIYPGDGILPLTQALKDLADVGYTGPLSLELFNETLWAQDPAQVAHDGLAKMRSNIAAAGV